MRCQIAKKKQKKQNTTINSLTKHFKCVYLLNIHICGYLSKQLFFPDNTKMILNATKKHVGTVDGNKVDINETSNTTEEHMSKLVMKKYKIYDYMQKQFFVFFLPSMSSCPTRVAHARADPPSWTTKCSNTTRPNHMQKIQ